jgi:dienelactone hydrolase
MRRIRLIVPFAAALAVFLFSGCYTFAYQDPGPARPFVRPVEPIAAFAYEPDAARVTVLPPEEETAAYALSLLKFKGRDFEGLEKDSARVFWFGPKDPGANAPLLIVMPPTGGPYSLSLYFGKYFADRGCAVLCFLRREKFFKPGHDIDYHQELFRQTVIDVRRGIDWASAQPGVDGSRVGILGVSLGAIFAQLVMEADPRVAAGALLLGGQDLPLILESSGYTVVSRYRDALSRQYRVDADGLRAMAREHFRVVDPKNYGGRIDPARVLMISGRYDNIIRYEVTRETWENLGHPTLHVVPAGHYSSALFLPTNMARIYRHFDRLLGLSSAGVRSTKGDAHAALP